LIDLLIAIAKDDLGGLLLKLRGVEDGRHDTFRLSALGL